MEKNSYEVVLANSGTVFVSSRVGGVYLTVMEKSIVVDTFVDAESARRIIQAIQAALEE